MIFLFDCDGTLVDSEYAHYSSWAYAAAQFGKPFSLEEYIPYIGRSGLCIAKALTDPSHVQEMLQLKQHYFLELSRKGLPPIQPTIDFLHQLIREKQTIGVCSAARKEEILIHLDHLDLLPHLDVVLSGHEDLKDYIDPEGVNKPKPYIYLHAMKLLGSAPEETIAFEDSEMGVRAASTAGCFTVAIPNDYTRHHNFSAAHLCLPSLAGLSIQDLSFATNPQNRLQ